MLPMESNKVQLIAALQDQALHGNQQEILSATKKLLDLLGNPETVADLIQILHSSKDESARQSSAIYLRKAFVLHGQELPPEIVENAKSSLISLLQNEASTMVERYISDACAELLKARGFSWPEILTLADSFLSNENLVFIGLYLWTTLAEILSIEVFSHHISHLYSVVEQCLRSADIEMRLQSIYLLDYLLDLASDDQISRMPLLCQTLIDEASSSSLQERDQREVTAIFSLIEAQFTNRKQFIIDSSSQFLQMAYSIISSQANPLYRHNAISILAFSPSVQPEETAEKLSDYLGATIALTESICRLDRSSPELSSISTLIDSIGFETDSGTDLIDFLLSTASESVTSKDVIRLQVSLISITASVERCGEDLYERSDDLMNLVLLCLKEGDPILFDCSCKLLQELAFNYPSVYQKGFDDIIPLILQRISEPIAIQTLDTIMFYSEKPPSQYKEILSELSSLLSQCPQESYVYVISCMSSAICKVDEVNNEVYQELGKILVNLLNSENETRGKVFECFGFLAKISPAAIQSDLRGLVEVLWYSFSETEDGINEYIAICVTSLAKVLPISFKEYVGQFVSPFINLLKKPIPEEEEDEEEETPDMATAKMHSAIIQALSTLIAEFPHEMEQYVSDFVGLTLVYIDCPILALQEASIQSVFLMTDGLSALGFDCTALLSAIIDKITVAADISIANELLLALGGIYICFGSKMAEEQFKASIQLFEGVFSGKNEVFMSGAKSFNNSVLFNLFFALRQFIISVGAKFVPYVDGLMSLMKKQIKNNKKMATAYVIHTMAIIAYSVPNCEAVASSAKELGMRSLKDGNDSVSNIIMSAMNLLLHGNKEVFTERDLEILKERVGGVLENRGRETVDSNMVLETSATLWCSLQMVSGSGVDPSVFSSVVSLLPPVVDDDDIPFAAEFLYFAEQQYKDLVAPHAARIAAAVFASSDWIAKMVKVEVMAALAKLLSDVPEAELKELVKCNEHQLLQVQSHMVRFCTSN